MPYDGLKRKRWWINLRTLRHHANDLEYIPARQEAERFLGKNLGWFDSPESMNDYIRSEMIPALEAAWKANPYLRLGQLIANVVGSDRSVFAVSDCEMLEQLWSAAHLGG